jgi:hypothetical protein
MSGAEIGLLILVALFVVAVSLGIYDMCFPTDAYDEDDRDRMRLR